MLTRSALASGENDIIGHGTHVIGTIGALIKNDLGLNGICRCHCSMEDLTTTRLLKRHVCVFVGAFYVPASAG